MSDELKGDATPANPFRSEFQPLTDELYREKVLKARQMSPEEKFLAGEELFNLACETTLACIRSENPGLGEEECLRELERRLEVEEQMERRRGDPHI